MPTQNHSERRDRSVEGFCYFAFAPSWGVLKIGRALNPTTRLQTLVRQHRVSLVLIGARVGGYRAEAEEHFRWRFQCLRNPATETMRPGHEWFYGSQELIRYARACRDQDRISIKYTGPDGPWIPPLIQDGRLSVPRAKRLAGNQRLVFAHKEYSPRRPGEPAAAVW